MTPQLCANALGLMLMLLIGFASSAETAVGENDPARQVKQSYTAQSLEAASLSSLANTSCSEASKTKTQYTTLGHGLTISWDSKAKTYKLQLHNAAPAVSFRMPQQALSNTSFIHPGTYYLSTPQHARNMQVCGASALGDGTLVVRAQPGHEGGFADSGSASVTRFQAHKIQSSFCGDEIIIWGWLLGQKPRTPAEIARLDDFFRTNATVLSLPLGMDVTLILEGSLNTTNATSYRNAVALPQSCYGKGAILTASAPITTTTFITATTRSGNGTLLGAASSDCSAAFSGGAKDAVEQGAQVAIDIMSLLPGIGPVAGAFSLLGSYLQPATVVDGSSVYACISGFVEAAIDKKIGEYDLRRINQQLSFITEQYAKFSADVAVVQTPPSAQDMHAMQTDFDNAIQETDRMANIFLVSPGPVDPGGALPAFATFVSTQYLPILMMKYDSFTDIYGGTAEGNAKLRQMVLNASQTALSASVAFYNTTFAGLVSARSAKISAPEFSYSCSCSMCERNCKCCSSGYSFKDSGSGKEIKNSYWGTGVERGGSLLTAIEALRRLVVNRVESAMRINTFQATASRPLWPLLVAGGSSKVLQHRVVVEENLCFSNWVDCDSTNGNLVMPAGHNYQDYNITSFYINSGAWIDYVKVTYTHRTTGQQLAQEYGNPNSVGIPADGLPQNLLTDPIVKMDWQSETMEVQGVGALTGFLITQASGKVIQAGSYGANTYVDDFSLWSGNVYLCGMHIHGDAGKRVHGIAPHWCYTEAYTIEASSPPPSPSPSPPPPPSPPPSLPPAPPLAPPPPPPPSCTSDSVCGALCCSPSQHYCVAWTTWIIIGKVLKKCI